MEEILLRTLSKMGTIFSSNEFSSKAQKLGLSKRAISNGVAANFLHKNAIQLNTKRMWRKRNQVNENDILKREKSNEIAYAIDLLKANGYKILKQVSEWVDV